MAFSVVPWAQPNETAVDKLKGFHHTLGAYVKSPLFWLSKIVQDHFIRGKIAKEVLIVSSSKTVVKLKRRIFK